MNKKVVGSLILIIVLLNLNFVSAEGGGGAVRISTIDLTEQGNDYSITPRRLIFEFNGEWDAIQLRRVKDGYASFIVMDLDEDNLDNITAYIIDDSFSLTPSEKKEIDIDKDGIKDISIELNDIISTGKYNSIRSASFSIKKINTKKIETSSENITINDIKVISSNEATENETQESTIIEEETKKVNENITKTTEEKSTSEPIATILNQESKEQSTFLENMINFFKGLFG